MGGKERVGGRIPKVAGIGKYQEKFCNLAMYFARIEQRSRKLPRK